jgi:hypothetical protein
MDQSLHATPVALAVLVLAPALAHAGRPLVAEDAAILARGYCQVETWVQHNDGSQETWVAPHCNPGGYWELIAGAGHVSPHAGGSPRLLRAKAVLRPMSTNGWGVGIVLSDQFGTGDSVAGDLSLTVPLSLSLLDDTVRVHANAGWTSRRGGPDGMTWALAGEWNLARRAGVTLDAYGAGHQRSWLQAGARYELVPGRAVIDAAIGQRFGWHWKERYVAVGLTVTAQLWR